MNRAWQIGVTQFGCLLFVAMEKSRVLPPVTHDISTGSIEACLESVTAMAEFFQLHVRQAPITGLALVTLCPNNNSLFVLKCHASRAEQPETFPRRQIGDSQIMRPLFAQPDSLAGRKILFSFCSELSSCSHFVLHSLNTRFYSNSLLV